ncbi:unnamed protein product [Chrysodeixis includens]|uniref:Acyl-CoA-binding domain-containing protein 6 n=1 Tax=Chrysodeixis includens TaxID=689277 RepID=A0A9N8KWM6_CHRIL|nr:unnamed protein product [Chrysodeixis includens]
MAEALPEYSDVESDSDFYENDISPLDINFSKATDHVTNMICKLTNTQLLELYGLYKQGTYGRCNTPKPGWLDGKGRRKWEAWNALGDLSSEEAKHKYIALVLKYIPELKNVPNHEPPKETWAAVSSMRKSPEPELVQNEMSILDAARENCPDRIRELLAMHPEMCYESDDDGLTALHWAADRNATDALQALIEGGCYLDMTDEGGQSALHFAASCGHVEATKMLLNAGATLVYDDEDLTPLDVAVDEEIKKILEGCKKKK